MSVSHAPWEGLRLGEGVNGKKVLVVGYSHYCDTEEELSDPNLTIKILKRVITGEATHAFWTSIMYYFGFNKRADFWERVGFINFVPGPIGLINEKHRTASPEETKGAVDRILNVMKAQKSDIAIVFSQKAAWDAKTRLRELGAAIFPKSLDPADNVRSDYFFDDVRVQYAGKECRMIFTSHPQGAAGGTMRAIVDYAMNE